MATSTTDAARHDVADLSPLWEPLQVGPVQIKNRIVLNPLTTLWATGNVLTDRHAAYYEERARGGLGLIVSEQHIADRRRISAFRQSSSAIDPRAIPMLEHVGECVHAHGARMFIQLFAPGTLDTTGIDIDDWSPLWGQSAIPSRYHGEIPHVIGAEEIGELAANFGKAARNVAAAGLDGVELHASHSWLIHRFLSPLFNHRTDGYGVTPAGRCRIVIEIGESIRSMTSGIALGFQLSVDDYMGDRGVTLDVVDEQLAILADSGLFDYVNLSTGNEFSDDQTMPPMEMNWVPSEEYGARAKDIVGDRMAVLVGGGVQNIGNAARLVRDGAADLVALSRPHLADPHLVRKAREGRTDEIVPCVGENDCFRLAISNLPVSCLMNPAAGRERYWGSQAATRAEAARNVVVIGGGPSGLQAAITAAGRGHNVTLFERRDSLGGHLRLLARLPHRARWQQAVSSFETRARDAGVKIRLGAEASAATPQVRSADVVLCATGSRWQKTGFSAAVPDRFTVPGCDQPNVLDVAAAAERALDDPTALGSSVVIFDESGEYLPLGLADLLSAVGVRVRIVTRLDTVGQQVVTAFDHVQLFERLSGRSVDFTPQQILNEIEGSSVKVEQAWSGRISTITDIDTVVLSMLREPDAGAYAGIAELPVESRIIGDALAPRDTRLVIAEGHAAGYEI